MKISKVFLYDEPSVPELKIDALGNFIKEIFHVDVEIRPSIFDFFNTSKKRIIHDLASCRILDPINPLQRHEPTTEEIEFEENSFTNPESASGIMMYDGFEFTKSISNLISQTESQLDKFHLIFTNKLTCTYDYNDYRYHGRAVICSNPSIISITGVIEAPAKPREYYLGLFSNLTTGLNVNAIKNQFKGKYLEYHDIKLGEVIKGYVLQTLFYYLTGEPFCESKNCRLFNAHWQEDLLYSQLRVGELCNNHKQILTRLIKNYE